jgi:hypothetical protein
VKLWLTVFDYPTLEMQVPHRFHGHICTVKDRTAKFVTRNVRTLSGLSRAQSWE